MGPDRLWYYLAVGYALSVLIEAPILLVGLSARHPLGRRLFAGLWLTACTYPIVILVLPQFFGLEEQRVAYLWVAETFAPLAECALFWAAFGTREEVGRPSMWRDLAAITLANLASFPKACRGGRRWSDSASWTRGSGCSWPSRWAARERWPRWPVPTWA
jgi:hypothetical protein